MSEFFNSLIADWTGVIKGFTLLAGITLVVFTAIATRLAWGKILISMIVAGAVIWAVTANGLGWFSQKIDEETASGYSTYGILDEIPAETYVLAS